MQFLSMIRSSCARRFPPKIIITRIRRGRNDKKQERVRGGFFFGLWSLVRGQDSGRSDRCGTVKGAETARKGCGDVKGPKRVRLEEESRKSKPRFTDPRRKVRGEPNAGVRSQIPRPDFVVHRGPEEVPEERSGLQRRRPPRDDQGQGDRKKN
jgi:hypothetical protein